MTKLAIVQELEEDKYDHQTALKCWKCDAANGKTITADENTVRIFLSSFSTCPSFSHAILFGRRSV